MTLTVPMDVYDAPTEMVIVLPLGGVQKDSVILTCKNKTLYIAWERQKPVLKDSLTPLQEQCFWWIFEKEVMLPENAAFDRIYSELSPENILTIVVPKIVVPEEIIVKKL